MKKYVIDEEKMKGPPLTREEFLKELRMLGLSRGMVLLVEADSECLPYVVGGEQALIEALMDKPLEEIQALYNNREIEK